MALQPMQGSLRSMTGNLRHDPEVQNNIIKLVDNCQTAVQRFSDTVNQRGSDILRQKQQLTASRDPVKIRVQRLQEVLEKSQTDFSRNTSIVTELQTEIHTNIEHCRERASCHQRELRKKRDELILIQSQIRDLEIDISAYEIEANNCENLASQLDDKARDLKREADRGKIRTALVAVIGGAAGIVFAPFTGGVSLVISGAATGILTGINVADVVSCSNGAKKLRAEADRNRSEAASMQRKVRDSYAKKSYLEDEIDNLEIRTADLTEACRGLEEVSNFLHSSLNLTSRVLDVVQDIVVCIQEAKQQGNSFKIIQKALIRRRHRIRNPFKGILNAFGRNPRRRDPDFQKYVDQLREKWSVLEEMINGQSSYVK